MIYAALQYAALAIAAWAVLFTLMVLSHPIELLARIIIAHLPNSSKKAEPTL